MALAFSTGLRSSRAQAVVTEAGAGAKIKFYNGARPASGAAVASQVLLATLVCGAVMGTVASGVLTVGAVTQTNASHVAGAPTWVRITRSDDTFVADLSVPGDMTFTGTVTAGVNVTLNASTISEGNA